MNHEQLLSIVRQILLVLGGGLVARGTIDDATLNSVAGAASILIGSGWAIYARRRAGLVAAAASVPEVRTIVTTTDLAAAVPSGKVVDREGR